MNASRSGVPRIATVYQNADGSLEYVEADLATRLRLGGGLAGAITAANRPDRAKAVLAPVASPGGASPPPAVAPPARPASAPALRPAPSSPKAAVPASRPQVPKVAVAAPPIAAEGVPRLRHAWAAASAEVRAGFGGFEAYLDHHLVASWSRSPALRAEFAGHFEWYAATIRHEGGAEAGSRGAYEEPRDARRSRRPFSAAGAIRR